MAGRPEPGSIDRSTSAPCARFRPLESRRASPRAQQFAPWPRQTAGTLRLRISSRYKRLRCVYQNCTPCRRAEESRSRLSGRANLTLTRQHRSSIHVEYLASYEPGMLGAQEKNGAGNLLGRPDPAKRNGVKDGLPCFGISQGLRRHVRLHPAGRHAIDVNAVSNQFGRKSFDHADEGALGSSIVTMKGLAPLSRSRTDEHNMARNIAPAFLFFHLCDGMFDESENRVEVDGNCIVPLLRGHLLDRHIFRRPYSVIGNQDVEASESSHHLRDKFVCRGGPREIALNCRTIPFATLARQLFSGGFRLL